MDIQRSSHFHPSALTSRELGLICFVGLRLLLGLQINGLREQLVSDRCREDVGRPWLAGCLL